MAISRRAKSPDLEESSQEKFEAHSNDETELWEALEILNEHPTRGFLIKWAGNDPDTGKPWQPSWSEREHCTDELVREWREKQRARKQKRSKRSTRASRAPRASTTSSAASRAKRSSSTATGQPVASTSKQSPLPNPRKRVRSPDGVEIIGSNTEDAEAEVAEVEEALEVRPKKKRRGADSEEKHVALETYVEVLGTGGRGKGKGKDDVGTARSLSPREESESTAWVAAPGIKVGPPRRKSNFTSKLSKSRSRSTEDSSRPTANISSSTDAAEASGSKQPSNWTKSQIVALREEEEEPTQSQEHLHTVVPEPVAPQEDRQDDPKLTSPKKAVTFVPDHSTRQPSPSERPLFESSPSPKDDDAVDPDGEREGAQTSLQPSPASYQTSPTASAPTRVTHLSSSQGDSIKTQLLTPTLLPPDPLVSPTRASNATKTKALARPKTPPRKLGPIPQVSPSRFAPHLPQRDDIEAPHSSIEQFDSPEKSVAADGDSSIREWPEEERAPALEASGSGKNLIQLRAMAIKADMEARKRKLLSAKRPLAEILARPKTLTFLPDATGANGSASRSGNGVALKDGMADVIKGLESQDSLMVSQENSHIPEDDLPFDGVNGAGPSADQVVREMEEMYVDLDGGAQEDSQISVDKSLDSTNAQKSTSQDVVPATNSSKHPSDESQSQSQDSGRPLAERLTVALELLHAKSEEIARLQAQIRDYHQRTSSQGDAYIAAESQTEGPSSSAGDEVQQLQARFETEKQDMQSSFEAERKQLLQEKASLQEKLDWAELSKASAEKDVDFFREQYQTASAFASTTRAENDDLLTRAKLAESQAKDGVALVQASFKARTTKLEREVQKYKGLADMLTERARRTDDEVRMRAAREPELWRENSMLRDKVQELDAEIEEMTDELNDTQRENVKLEKVVKKLKTEMEVHPHPHNNTGKTKKRETQEEQEAMWSDDEEEDGDYLPGPEGAEPSSGDSDDTAPMSSPGLPSLDNESDQEEEAATGHGIRRKDGQLNGKEGLVYMCKWRFQDTKQLCLSIVSTKEELRQHVFTEHLAIV